MQMPHSTEKSDSHIPACPETALKTLKEGRTVMTIMRLSVRMLMLALPLVGWIAVAGASATGFSMGSEAGKNDQCLSCHSKQDKVTGKNFIDPLKLKHYHGCRIKGVGDLAGGLWLRHLGGC
jgi:hypothetical protein